MKRKLYLVAFLVQIVDFLERDYLRSKAVAQLGQQNPVSQALLQLCWGRQVLMQTSFHPPKMQKGKGVFQAFPDFNHPESYASNSQHVLIQMLTPVETVQM